MGFGEKSGENAMFKSSMQVKTFFQGAEWIIVGIEIFPCRSIQPLFHSAKFNGFHFCLFPAAVNDYKKLVEM